MNSEPDRATDTTATGDYSLWQGVAHFTKAPNGGRSAFSPAPIGVAYSDNSHTRQHAFHSAFRLNRAMLPKQGTASPWLNTQNYALDKKVIGKGPIEDGCLQFTNKA